jgi:hypothetical protein
MLSCDPEALGRVTLVTLDRPPATALNRAFFDELIARRLRGLRSGRWSSLGRAASSPPARSRGVGYAPRAFDEFTERLTPASARSSPSEARHRRGERPRDRGRCRARRSRRLPPSPTAGADGPPEILLGSRFLSRHGDRPPCLRRPGLELLYHGRTYPPREAQARRLADEVVPAAELLPRACALAEELASRPRAAFASTKASLRADALRRLDDARRAGDPAWDIWRSAETHAAVEAYRARTLGPKGRG